jgi:hypothetical protein
VISNYSNTVSDVLRRIVKREIDVTRRKSTCILPPIRVPHIVVIVIVVTVVALIYHGYEFGEAVGLVAAVAMLCDMVVRPPIRPWRPPSAQPDAIRFPLGRTSEA